MATVPIQRRADANALIPDRLYFKIGDVASICGVAPSVLRFWETQFPQLKPNKSGTGQRLYRKRDVELALEIKRRVHEEGFTLAGARQAMAAQPIKRSHQHKSAEVWQGTLLSTQPEQRSAVLTEVRSELRQLLMQLSRPVGMQPARSVKRLDEVKEVELQQEPQQMGLFVV
jgi:DNA-binding transcriptional MerR regulator